MGVKDISDLLEFVRVLNRTEEIGFFLFGLSVTIKDLARVPTPRGVPKTFSSGDRFYSDGLPVCTVF